MRLKNESGFTLVEVLVAIVILAITGVFSTQIFVASAKASKKAQDIDIASAVASTAVEEYLSGKKIPVKTFFDEEWNVLRSAENEEDKVFVMYVEISDLYTGGEDSRSVKAFSNDGGTNINYGSAGKLTQIRIRITAYNNGADDLGNDIDSSLILAEFTAKKYVKGSDL